MQAVNPFLGRIPADIREEFLKDLAQGLVSRMIRFRRDDDCDQTGYRILDRYEILVAHVRRPLETCRED